MAQKDVLKKRQKAKKLPEQDSKEVLSSEEIAVLGHGLKSPLARIVALSELLLQEVQGELNKDQKEYVQDIYNNSFLVLNSINSLLNLAQIEAGLHKLNIGPFNMRDIVESVVAKVDSVAASKGSKIIIDIPENLPIVYCDRYKIEQVLYNLLDNSIKFTFDGTINVAVRELPDSNIEVAVSDTGIGVKEKNKAKVFDKFFTEKCILNPGGSGLGLMVVQEIVNLHKGKVWLESQEGQGTTVIFVIPNRIPDKKELLSDARGF